MLGNFTDQGIRSVKDTTKRADARRAKALPGRAAGNESTPRAYIAQLDEAHVFPRPIVTKVEPLQAFYPAEPYHQDYATRHPESAYIAINDLPKIENLQKLYPELYRQQPVLVGSSSQ
jgi:hypothetical protein